MTNAGPGATLIPVRFRGVIVCLAALQAAASDIPFSHKRHAPLKLECAYCHEKAVTAERAGFPTASKCMLCHAQTAKDSSAIQRLAGLPKETVLAPEKLVYRLPDFVVFSHARHKKDSISCANCHGDVWAMEVVERQLAMKMKACVDCHREHHAAVTCTTCHEQFQQ